MLQTFLELPGVWIAIEHNKSQSDGILRAFQDGSYYQSNELLSQPHRITLGLYNDDMETVNPLGSHISTHELSFFNYIVKELLPVYNSHLANSHLLQVYYSADRKKYGFSSILANIADELKSLEKVGLEICVSDAQICAKVALGQVSGEWMQCMASLDSQKVS